MNASVTPCRCVSIHTGGRGLATQFIQDDVMPAFSHTSTSRKRRLSQNLVPENTSPSVRQGDLLNVQDQVELLEVTANDIRCVLNVNPNLGDTVSFEVQTEGGLTSVSGLVHWKELRRHGYEIGLYLPTGLRNAPADLLTDIRRKGNRYRCRHTGMFHRHKTQQRTEAVVVNYSYDGFAVQTSSFCDVDESVTFEWLGSQTQRISGVVLWQIEQQHGVLLGCQCDPGTGYRIGGLNV